jgi:hypothetical protein
MQGPTEAVIAARAEKRRQTLERVTAYYARFDAAHWRRRFAEAAAGGPPLRVLGITTRYSTVLRYSMEELQAAAIAGPGPGVNVQMEICMEPDEQSLEKDYSGMIDRLKPDLLVTISRMRYENPDLPRNVPALCWDQDNLPCMRDPHAWDDLKGLTFVAGHGTVFGAIHLNWPLEACIFCHPAGMTHRYQPGEPSAEEQAQFGSDVSYVSHASGPPDSLRDSLRLKWQGGAREYGSLFDKCIGQVLQGRDGSRYLNDLDLHALIRTSAEHVKAPLTAHVERTLLIDLRLFMDRAFRHETLAWVARWCEARGKRLRLWGNGWDKHPTLAKWAAGAAIPGQQAQAVYRASRINLQIIETGILHSRLLDGWAAGGFFLMRQPDRAQDEELMRTLFRIGQLTEREHIATLGQLESRGSEELRGLWSRIAAEHLTRSREREFPEFRIWQRLLPAHLMFPGLERLMFNDAAEFEKLADTYSGAQDARREVLAGIRQELLKHLSYDARWRDFIGHMTAHIGYDREQPGAPSRCVAMK